MTRSILRVYSLLACFFWLRTDARDVGFWGAPTVGKCCEAQREFEADSIRRRSQPRSWSGGLLSKRCFSRSSRRNVIFVTQRKRAARGDGRKGDPVARAGRTRPRGMRFPQAIVLAVPDRSDGAVGTDQGRNAACLIGKAGLSGRTPAASLHGCSSTSTPGELRAWLLHLAIRSPFPWIIAPRPLLHRHSTA